MKLYRYERLRFDAFKQEGVKVDKVVLVITSESDAHADFICPKIEKCGVRTFRFNTDRLDRYEVDFRISPGNHTFSIGNRKSHQVVRKEDICSVWFRRPEIDTTFDALLDEEGAKFFKEETREWIKSINFALKDCFWVVAPWVLYEASVKTNQLIVAQSVGLQVPETLVARDANVVRAFFAYYPHGIIAKTIGTQYLEGSKYTFVFRTQEISKTDLKDKNLFISPSMFQEKVEVAYELRIVAIGKKLFAFKALPTERKFVDIKSHGFKEVKYTPIDISKETSTKIRRLLQHFHLPFSSMDLLVDKEGKEYFIDLNPNGQWLWLEMETGVVMSDLFVEMLVGQKIS